MRVVLAALADLQCAHCSHEGAIVIPVGLIHIPTLVCANTSMRSSLAVDPMVQCRKRLELTSHHCEETTAVPDFLATDRPTEGPRSFTLDGSADASSTHTSLDFAATHFSLDGRSNDRPHRRLCLIRQHGQSGAEQLGGRGSTGGGFRAACPTVARYLR